ncbi:MAG: four helix bundle protein [Anaerolineales bacterium]
MKVYQLAYKLAMDIFNANKSFPKEEKYSLTDQIRRSSRSIAANIAGYLVPDLDLANQMGITREGIQRRLESGTC